MVLNSIQNDFETIFHTIGLPTVFLHCDKNSWFVADGEITQFT